MDPLDVTSQLLLHRIAFLPVAYSISNSKVSVAGLALSIFRANNLGG